MPTAADVIIQAIQNAQSSGGNIVDARALSGAQVIDKTINVPQNMHLMLGNAIFTVNITNGSPVFVLGDAAHLEGIGMGTWIRTTPNANVPSLVTNLIKSGTGQEYFYLSNLQMDKADTATVSIALIDIQAVFTNSYIRDIVMGPNNSLGLLMHSLAGGIGCGPVDINNCWFDGHANQNGTQNPNSRLVKVLGEPGGGGIQFMFRNCCFEHAGPTQPMVEICGGMVAGSGNVITQGLIESCYFESPGAIGIYLNGGQNTTVIGCSGAGIGNNSGNTMIECKWTAGSVCQNNLFIGVNGGNGFQYLLKDYTEWGNEAPPQIISNSPWPNFLPFYHQEYTPNVFTPARFQQVHTRKLSEVPPVIPELEKE